MKTELSGIFRVKLSAKNTKIFMQNLSWVGEHDEYDVKNFS